MIPASWSTFFVPPAKLSLSDWIQNLALRLDQAFKLPSDRSGPVWLGGLFNPAGFLIATRQATSRKLKIPLESLLLNISSVTKNVEGPVYDISGVLLSALNVKFTETNVNRYENTRSPLERR